MAVLGENQREIVRGRERERLSWEIERDKEFKFNENCVFLQKRLKWGKFMENCERKSSIFEMSFSSLLFRVLWLRFLSF